MSSLVPAIIAVKVGPYRKTLQIHEVKKCQIKWWTAYFGVKYLNEHKSKEKYKNYFEKYVSLLTKKRNNLQDKWFNFWDTCPQSMEEPC